MSRRYEKKFLDYQVKIMTRQVEEVNDIYMTLRIFPINAGTTVMG